MFEDDASIDPDEHLRPNQRHLDPGQVLAPPQAIEVLDRNGAPTGKFKYNIDGALTITLRGLMQVRALEARRVRAEYEDRLAVAAVRAGSLEATARKLQAERDELSAIVHLLNREANEERVQTRIREAVSAATDARDREIAALKARCAGLESENAALREAKRRLKMAGRR